MMRGRAILAGVFVFFAAVTAACAQSSPNFYTGEIPTAAQWNAAFAQKQDVLGYTPVNKGGDFMAGPLVTYASAAAAAGLNIPSGVAPNSPNNGDLWLTQNGLYVQVGLNTIGPLAAASSSSFAATAPLAVSFPLNVTTYALNFDSNFVNNGSNDLALANAASGDLIANAGAGSAEPVATDYSTWFDRTIGGGAASDGMLPWRTGGVWGNISTGTTGATLPLNNGGFTQSGNVNFTGAFDIGGTAQTFPASGSLVGATDTQTLTNKSLTSPTITSSLTATNLVTNGDLAQGSAATIKGNPTASAANVSDFTIQGLSSDSSPDMSLDLMPIYNHMTGTIQNVSASQLFGSVGDVTSVTNADRTLNVSPTVGAVVASAAAIGAPGGRLTLTSKTPVMTSSVTAGGVSTLYYDSYANGFVPVYNGTITKLDAITSNEMEDLIPTSGTGVANAGGVFDEFFYDKSGSGVICHATNGSGGGWASDGGSNTARGTGYSALSRAEAFVTNNNAIADCYNGSTNEGSIPANEATYLGTFATDASNAGKIDFTLGTTASSGGAAIIGIWNYSNRINITTSVTDNSAAYTYASTSIREAHNSATMRITAVFGAAEDPSMFSYGSVLFTPATAGSGGAVGICVPDTTGGSGFLPTVGLGEAETANSLVSGASANTSLAPLIGLHFVQACEQSFTTGTLTLNYQTSPYNQFLQTLTGTWSY